MGTRLREHLRHAHCWEQDFIDSCEDDDLEQQHTEAHERSDSAPEGTRLFDIAYPHEHPRDRFEELLHEVGLNFTLGRSGG
jgi:hypothetical protein